MKDGPQEIDILHWMGRTALELIGQGGLGTSFDPLVEDVKNPFAEAIKNLVYVQFRISCIVSIDHSLQAIFFTARSLPTSHTLYNFYWYSAFRAWVIDLLPVKRLRMMKSIANAIHLQATGVFQDKKAALQAGDDVLAQKIGEGKDLMSILCKLDAFSP